MLSYQHAYHAGGPADLHKHLILAELLDLLTRKPRSLSYFETHAGRGMYDLTSTESKKTGEAAEGISAITLPDCPLRRALEQVQERHGADIYPGSPLIAQTLLRPDDRLHLMELHPAEVKALRANLKAPNTTIHHRDGFEGVLALAPPKPRKGLVLVDPSYEIKSEYSQAAAFCRKLVAKWPEATILVWYPILPAARHNELLDGLQMPHLVNEVAFDLKDGKGMTGSGMVMLGAPYGAEAIFKRAMQSAQGLLRPKG